MVTGLLQQLIRIPSVNPEGDPGTDRVGEGDCARFVADLLQKHAEIAVTDVLPGRPNITARFPSDRPDKPRILFAPHTDTVSVVGMTIAPFGGEIHDGKIWGRGASDTKGSMAAMLAALLSREDQLPHLTHEIWFAGLMGEEAGQHGSRALAEQEKFDFVIVGEPTSLQTVHAHKGSIWITLHAHGQSAHASTPERGQNAIEPVMAALMFMRDDFHRAFDTLADPVLGCATLNIGTIRGGSKVNIVPEDCTACVDIRTLPGQDLDSWIAAVQAKFPEVGFVVTGSAPLYTDPGHPLIGALQKCGAQPVGAPWFCDAAVFSRQGVPAVALGPGSIAQAHTCDEWIKISDLEAGVAFFQQFLDQLLPS